MDELLTLGQEVLESQPFSKLIGAQLTQFSIGSAELRIKIKEELNQQHGFVHGGVLSYAADNTLTFVGGSILGPGVVTSEYKINYLRPAIGEELIARGSVIHSGKNQVVCRCEIFVIKDGEEKLCAFAVGTIARIGSSSNQDPS